MSERCAASSWRGPRGKDDSRFYGPGGWNRCRKNSDGHSYHVDDWGNCFVLAPAFRVVAQLEPTPVRGGAEVARD